MLTEQKTGPTGASASSAGLLIDTDVMFSDRKGRYSKRVEKRRTKLLRKLGFIRRFLDPGERVLLVTPGCSPFSTVEQMTIGALWVILLKRAVFVFTDKRMLHIPTKTDFTYRGSIAQVLYRDCRLYVKGSHLMAEYGDGSKERFSAIPRADRAILKQLPIGSDGSENPSESPRRNHLCPICAQVLARDTANCPSCGLEFKTKAKGLKYSLLIPGGGYFYANHPLIGAGDALTEAYLGLLMLAALAAGLLGEPGGLVAAGFVAVILALEKLITVYHSNSFLNEFIPVDLKSVLKAQHTPPATAPVESVSEEERPPVEQVLSVR